MHNQARQENISTPSRLADNLIGSLGGLTAVDRAELRRQVVMLINHSYALGYAAGIRVGLMARIRLRVARAWFGAGRNIKQALSAIRERLTMSLHNHKPRSRQMLAQAFVRRYPMRAARITDGDPVKFFQANRPAALLVPATDWEHQNQMNQPIAGSLEERRPKPPEGAPSQFRVTRDLGRAATLPQPPQTSGRWRDQDASEINLSRFYAKKQPGNNPTVANPGRQINDRASILPGLQASRPY
jgi:hypothetical protein